MSDIIDLQNNEQNDPDIRDFLSSTSKIREELDTEIGVEDEPYYPQREMIRKSLADFLPPEGVRKIVFTNSFYLNFDRLMNGLLDCRNNIGSHQSNSYFMVERGYLFSSIIARNPEFKASISSWTKEERKKQIEKWSEALLDYVEYAERKPLF
ncbi:MAG: hypothetical protein KKA07_06520 [Bacteroidetes bacterium]|nr:hypothetical protein [Bacteroidota bacterium]MBU1718710.1 hypothetical protein [Bacteroidota bacterium]